jgi:hypothetical protein
LLTIASRIIRYVVEGMKQEHQNWKGKARAESAQLAVERATGSPAEHLESVPVIETFRGETVWEGLVEVFRVLNPPPDRAYGWAVEGSAGPDYIAVGKPPVDSPLAAVRAWIASGAKQ